MSRLFYSFFLLCSVPFTLFFFSVPSLLLCFPSLTLPFYSVPSLLLCFPSLSRHFYSAFLLHIPAATFQARGAEAEGQAVLSFLTLDSKVSILTEAMDRRGRGRGSSGRRAGPPRLSPTPRREGTVSVWNRTIDTTDVRQMALSVDNDSTVTVHSFDRRLRSLGLRPGAVLYDFSDAAVAVSARGSGGRGRRWGRWVGVWGVWGGESERLWVGGIGAG